MPEFRGALNAICRAAIARKIFTIDLTDRKPEFRQAMSLVRPWIGGIPMAFKPNYRFGRAERDRLKQAKKDEKLKRQQARASFAARRRLDRHDRRERSGGNLIFAHLREGSGLEELGE